jgi:hypothetical protein
MTVSKKRVSGLCHALSAALALAPMSNLSATDVATAFLKPSSETIEAAHKDGLDLTKLPTSPGLHIVPLEDSPFVGPVAERVRSEIAQQASIGSYTAEDGVVPNLRLASQAVEPTRGASSRLDRR